MLDPIELPSDEDSEDVFLPLGMINLSMRQVAALMSAFILWFVAGFIVDMIIGSMAFGLIIFGWILVLGLVMAFVRINDRWFEEWLADWLYYHITPRQYALMDDDLEDERSLASDVDWEFLDDDIDTVNWDR